MKPAFRFGQQLTAGMLAAWLSGLLLLLCCANMARAQIIAAEQESHHCPLKKIAATVSDSHCEKASGATETTVEFNSFENVERNLNCCIFLPKIVDKARGVEQNPHSPAAVVSTAKLENPKFSFVVNFVAAPPNYNSVIHNRGSIYLKNRVFRI